jgi:hypothetical protein
MCCDQAAAGAKRVKQKEASGKIGKDEKQK